MGNILSDDIVSALSVGLYGMFIAIIIPPAKQNKIIAGLIIVAMTLSLLFRVIPVLASISSGTSVLLLTILVSGAAAFLFPIKNEEEAN